MLVASQRRRDFLKCIHFSSVFMARGVDSSVRTVHLLKMRKLRGTRFQEIVRRIVKHEHWNLDTMIFDELLNK